MQASLLPTSNLKPGPMQKKKIQDNLNKRRNSSREE